MGKNGLKSTPFLMPDWTQLTTATSALCHLPSAGPRFDRPLGTGLHSSAPAGARFLPWLVLKAPVKALDAGSVAQPSS